MYLVSFLRRPLLPFSIEHTLAMLAADPGTKVGRSKPSYRGREGEGRPKFIEKELVAVVSIPLLLPLSLGLVVRVGWPGAHVRYSANQGYQSGVDAADGASFTDTLARSVCVCRGHCVCAGAAWVYRCTQVVVLVIGREEGRELTERRGERIEHNRGKLGP